MVDRARGRRGGLAVRAAMICALFGWSSSASAVELSEPIDVVRVTGPAVVRGTRIVVRCTGEQWYEPWARCRLDARFELLARGAVTLERSTPDGVPSTSRSGELLVDGAPLERRTLPAGARVAVTISAQREQRRQRDPIMMSAMQVRHALLGDSSREFWMGGSTEAELVLGTEVTLQLPVVVEVDAPEHVVVSVGGEEVRARAEVRAIERPAVELGVRWPGSASALRHGGPVIAGGVVHHFDDNELSLSLRAGYEIGILEYFFVSIWVETDLSSIMESLLFEAALPAALVVFGSLSAGLGVVARQLGDREPDAALRIRFGIHYPFIGISADLDYWPAIEQWTATTCLRVSL